MRRRVLTLAAAISMVLLVSGIAVADSTITTTFEPPAYHLGTVNGQGSATPWPGTVHCAPPVPQAPLDCWKSAVPGNIPSLPNGYDQEVVANTPPAPAQFGSQSLRLSNAYGTGPTTFPPEYHYQTYSKPTTEAAGEGLANTEYTAQFSFISIHPNQLQDGLKISLSPDMGEGGRMSYIGLTDTAAGIDVTFFDTPILENGDVDFAGYDLGTLTRNQVHTIKFWMKLNPGPNDDLLRIYIDGQDYGQCFTTWENFYRATSQEVPISDRLLFLSGNRDGDHLSLLHGGYLFDDVRTTTANGPGPPNCDVPIEKKPDQRTVTAGGNAGYRITVRNRGRVAARHLLACDLIPRRMTFVRADHKLIRVGRRRCLLIPRLLPGHRVSVHLVLHVNANAPQGRMDNTGEIMPPPPPPPPPGVVPEPPAPERPIVKPPPIARDKAGVRVVKRAKAKKPPRFTG
jgi:uncharacterized repeat protein (TIGR01451 family)